MGVRGAGISRASWTRSAVGRAGIVLGGAVVLLVVLASPARSEEERATLEVSPDAVAPGETVIVRGEGFASDPYNTIDVMVGGTYTTSVVADEDGRIEVQVTVPAHLEAGPTEVTAIGANKAGEVQVLADVVEITASQAEPPPPAPTRDPTEPAPPGAAPEVVVAEEPDEVAAPADPPAQEVLAATDTSVTAWFGLTGLTLVGLGMLALGAAQRWGPALLARGRDDILPARPWS